jgi:hypothetical protein
MFWLIELARRFFEGTPPLLCAALAMGRTEVISLFGRLGLTVRLKEDGLYALQVQSH